jgi:hypothetical protein
MTVLAEEFVDVFDDPVTLANFPPTFETLTRGNGFWAKILAKAPSGVRINGWLL